MLTFFLLLLIRDFPVSNNRSIVVHDLDSISYLDHDQISQDSLGNSDKACDDHVLQASHPASFRQDTRKITWDK